MRVGLSDGLDPAGEKGRDSTGRALRKQELLAQVGQEPEAKKTINHAPAPGKIEGKAQQNAKPPAHKRLQR